MRPTLLDVAAMALVVSTGLVAGSAPAQNTPADPYAGMTREEKGLAIAQEADRRDFGFGDNSADLEMVLTNRNGAVSRRELRMHTLEVADPELGDKSKVIFDLPRDIANTSLLTYSRILEPDDQWLYLPRLKRVKRISSVNKSGPFMGSEFAYEDLSSAEVAKFSYEYLRDEPCGELVCYVVERTPLYEHSGYTSQVTWIDQTEYRTWTIKYYDRKGALLKTLTASDFRLYLDQYWRPHDLFMDNHQTGKTTRLLWRKIDFRTGLSERDFTRASLQRAG